MPSTRAYHHATARIPLTKRITHYLRRAEGPQHTTVIAQHIKAARLSTAGACERMAADGRLRRTAPGTYALAVEEPPHV
jgi:hypothetical protein